MKNGSWEGELDQQRSDGMSLVVASRWVIDRERWGTHSAILVMNKDITARKRAEAEAARERQLLSESIEELVRAREAALEHSRLKSEFLANMSHEIRTPMNGVIGMTSLLYETDLDREQKDCVATIRDSGQALMNIINDILDFSKIEAGKLTIETEDFNLRVVMADVAELMAATASQKHLELTCDFPPGLAEWYEGDAGRIRQILVNLVGNAVKFTNDGQVVVSTRLIGRTADRATVRLSVRDTGIGIAPSRQEVIFESFTQADGSISRRYGGTGLGLAICRRLTELMGGRIGLDSEHGRGSEFWLELNLAERCGSQGHAAGDCPQLGATGNASADPSDEFSTPNLHLAGVRVLVAEDNATNQKVAKRILERLGCHADAVFNGREALDMLARFPYNLVLMDVQMPEMDGYVATSEIRHRERGHGRRLPVIAMTAHAMKGDRERCLAAGMDDYLGKPVTHQGLAQVLERWCSSSKQLGTSSTPRVTRHLERAVVFQFERLHELSGGDPSTERELVLTFLGDTVCAISKIRAAFAASDATQLAVEVHGLLGACRTLGADSMAVFCQELERMARAGSLPPSTSTLAACQLEYENLSASLGAYMESLAMRPFSSSAESSRG